MSEPATLQRSKIPKIRNRKDLLKPSNKTSSKNLHLAVEGFPGTGIKIEEKLVSPSAKNSKPEEQPLKKAGLPVEVRKFKDIDGKNCAVYECYIPHKGHVPYNSDEEDEDGIIPVSISDTGKVSGGYFGKYEVDFSFEDESHLEKLIEGII